MKKAILLSVSAFVLTCCVFLSACSGDELPETEVELDCIEHIGQVPGEFETIVKNNVFEDITAFGDRLLKAEIISVNENEKSRTHHICMMDLYGKTLATYTLASDDAYNIRTMIATDDGGFLFVLGFEDYSYGGNGWASDNGFASRIIKCDSSGKLQFDTSLDGVEGYALRFCFEKNGNFYLFGEKEALETKTRGVGSATDIFMVVLDKNGKLLKTSEIAGTDFDSLDVAEISEDKFVLSISSQSDDGDFAGSNSNGYPTDWVVVVNDNLEIIEKKKETGRDYFDDRIGEKDGLPVYKSSDYLKGFDAGTPHSFIDYGDYYLIISENVTGKYEKTPPMVSSILYYTETVYSAYDYNGELLFRTAVDSSPDYDAMAESFYK